MADYKKCFWHTQMCDGTDYCCLVDMPILSDEQCEGCPEFEEDT